MSRVSKESFLRRCLYEISAAVQCGLLPPEGPHTAFEAQLDHFYNIYKSVHRELHFANSVSFLTRIGLLPFDTHSDLELANKLVPKTADFLPLAASADALSPLPSTSGANLLQHFQFQPQRHSDSDSDSESNLDPYFPNNPPQQPVIHQPLIMVEEQDPLPNQQNQNQNPPDQNNADVPNNGPEVNQPNPNNPPDAGGLAGGLGGELAGGIGANPPNPAQLNPPAQNMPNQPDGALGVAPGGQLPVPDGAGPVPAIPPAPVRPAQADGLVVARRPPLKFSECMPQSYSGEKSTQNCRDFLTKYKDYVRIHNLDDQQALDRFSVCLSGVARQWIDVSRYKTFQELETAFLNRFAPLHSRGAILRALTHKTLQVGQSVDQYLYEIKELGSRLQLSKTQIRDYFINGLPDAIKSVITMLQLEDLDEIVLRVQTHMELTNSSLIPTAASDPSPLLSMHDIYQSIQDIKRLTDSNATELKSIQSAVTDSSKSNGSFSSDSKAKSYARNPNSHNNTAQPRFDTKRNQSSRGSHKFSSNSRTNNGVSLSKQSNSFSSAIVCTYCGKTGHSFNMCLKRASDQGFQLALRGSWSSRRPGRSFQRGNQAYQSPRPFSFRSRPWSSRQPFFNPGANMYAFPSPYQQQNNPFSATANFGDSYHGNSGYYNPQSYGNQFSQNQYRAVEAPNSQFPNSAPSNSSSAQNQSSGDSRIVTFRSPPSRESQPHF